METKVEMIGGPDDGLIINLPIQVEDIYFDEDGSDYRITLVYENYLECPGGHVHAVAYYKDRQREG